ncbi:hypothetical protein F2Q68_00032605 [Brassica cretica]|uniref:Uncharacterized protein n=1 Tax=Brassica cretica TaxID=69181 RepID=A0A8S9GA38_BRACR|nr:hypothetical protein F2Q68_00032605 [Brassica cretica]
MSVTNAVRLSKRSSSWHTLLTLPRPTHNGWLRAMWKNCLPSRTMGEESNQNNGMDQLLLDALTARMTTVMTTMMDQRLEN